MPRHTSDAADDVPNVWKGLFRLWSSETQKQHRPSEERGTDQDEM